MSVRHSERRSRNIKHLAIIAGVLAALLLLFSLLGDRDLSKHARTGELVFPNIPSSLEIAPTIRVTTADTNYTIKRSPMGWGLVESGGYPVRADRMEVMASAIRTLRWGDVKTRDPAKFERLGLGNPDQDGSGALIEVILDGEEPTASLLTGRKNDRIYGRYETDSDVSFQIDGDLPPLYTRQAWLDLNVVEIPQAVIKSVRLVRPDGDNLYLEREAGGGPRTFRPAPPNQDDVLLSRIAATGPALAITRFFPTDVKPASELKTEWVARHISVTHDALEVDVRAYKEADGFYVTMRAVEAGDGANRAESINAKAEGWAFRLSEFDWADFAPEISSIVKRAE